MIFNNKKDKENRIICRIKDERIGNVRAARFLGVTIDTKLKFDRHLKEVQVKVNKVFNIM